MLFLLRCTFFLGLVFWAIPPGQPGAGGDAAAALRGAATRAGAAAGDAASRYCENNPAVCLAAASRLAAGGEIITPGRIVAMAEIAAGRGKSPQALTERDLSIPWRGASGQTR
jgi:hypothetical protein